MRAIKIKKLIDKMTLEEKASICSGEGSWYTKEIQNLGIPAVMLSDGPHGLRKQDKETDHLGINDSVKTVCFPAACATACSFDKELLYEMGKTLGKECRAEEVAVLLGPAINIKRSPLCGRNFEYISEDPYLSGELSVAYIKGIQSMGVGTSLKHFAANNQEHERMNGSSNVDERTLREIYLSAFERSVKGAQPWSVMCSYNRLNGIYASENKYLLTEVLRDEWGFDGVVMSDWGAVSDRVAGVNAGLDLEMPGSGGVNDELIIQAVKGGKLGEDALNRSVERILRMVLKYQKDVEIKNDLEKDHQKATQIEKESIVLLKNDNQTLPLSKEESTAMIGCFADQPRYQGGGSSHVNAYRIVSAKELAEEYGDISYAKGFELHSEAVDLELEREAVELAARSEKVLIFAGLPDEFESEGYDREHMRLPENQNVLINKIAALGKPVIVVLHNGAPVEMPWVTEVSSIVEAYLGGEAVGEAVMDILYGRENPCGKLAETFPVRIEDTPCYLNYPGINQQADYTEGIFVGYRYYDKKKMDVLFPFGHGLSYSTYDYSNIKVSKDIFTAQEGIAVSVDIMNTGGVKGKEIVQLYVTDGTGAVIRPEKELKGFEKVELQPGESKTVVFHLDQRAFAWYDSEISDWSIANGEYVISIGKSSRDIQCTYSVKITGNREKIPHIDRDTMIGDLLACSITRKYVQEDEKILRFIRGFTGQTEGEKGENKEMIGKMVKYMPLRALRSFSEMDNNDLDVIVQKLKRIVAEHEQHRLAGK